MADIAAQPFINYGLSQAQQGQAQASAALTNQQAQGAQMQNQILKMQMPFIQKWYSQAAADSDTNATEDTSGVAGGPLGAKQQTLDDNGFDPADVTAHNQATFGVPQWMGNEYQNMRMAALTGQENIMKTAALARQQRLDTMNQRSQWAASNQYAKYAAAAQAPDAYSALQQIDPDYTKWLDNYAQQFQDRTGVEYDKEDAAKSYALYQAADLHHYTNRPLDFQNGKAVDKETGLPVAGVPELGLNPKDMADMIQAAQSPTVEIPTGVPGQTRKVAPYFAAGYSNVSAYLAAVQQNIAPGPTAISAMKFQTSQQLAQFRTQFQNKAVQTAAQGNAPAPFVPSQHPAPDPQDPGQPVPMPPHPPRRTAPPAGAAPPPAGAAPPPAGAAPPVTAGSIRTGHETLPGVNPNALPKFQQPQNAPGVSGSTQQNTDIQQYNTQKYADLKDATTHQHQNATERGMLAQAQMEIDRLKNDPRMTGPGSNITQAWNEFKTYAFGQAPDPLVEKKMFDKVLLLMGAANVKNTLSGMGGRVGQQEFMKVLTEGNPTTSMPLPAIQRLIDYARFNNDFDTRYQNTRVAALKSGADPYSQEYADLDQGREQFVQARMGDVTPNVYGALSNGDPFYYNGKRYVKGVVGGR